MPELPEVETVVRDLRPLLVGRRLAAVRVGPHTLRRPWKAEWVKPLTGATVAAIRRRGKWIVVELEEPLPPTPFPKREGGASIGGFSPSPLRGGVGDGLPLPLPPTPFPKREGGAGIDGFSPSPLRGGVGEGLPFGSGRPCLLVHLGMTGQFTVAPASDPARDHTHVVFDLDTDHQLRFRDIRRFGSVELLPDAAAVDAFLAKRLGPEPFALDPAAFRAAVRKSGRPLKAILLDQTVVAGVGNIYADEALHRAGLHPETRGTAVAAKAADRLREAIGVVLTHAIEHRGSTIRDYVGGSGLRGGYQDEFRVYGRTGDPCGGCAAVIEVVRVAGRSSHYCPSCQGRGARGNGRPEKLPRPKP